MAIRPHEIGTWTPLFRTLALGFSAALGLAGCAQKHYVADSLPEQYVAPRSENLEEINLARLANYSADSELIDRGDVLEVTLVTDLSDLDGTTTPVRVREDGRASVPLIGEVALAGLELEGAEQTIAAAAKTRGIFQNPHVTVTMKRQRKNRITVIGAVDEPGVYHLPRGSSTLLAALVAAGGLSEDAGPNVEVRRPVATGGAPDILDQPPASRLTERTIGEAEQVSYETEAPRAAPARVRQVNLVEAAAGGYGGGYLDDGDVVMVSKQAPKPIYVIGLVNKPGEFELPPNQEVRMLDAIAKAGERSIQVADRVLIIRRVGDRPEPIVIEASVRKAKRSGEANLRLAPGDIVSVEETPTTVLVNAVTNVIRIGVGGSFSFF